METESGAQELPESQWVRISARTFPRRENRSVDGSENAAHSEHAVLRHPGRSVSAHETIGPFAISQAPVSATGSLGGVWGNVVNSPVTVGEAFSGFSIMDDGWINIVADAFFEVTVNPPVINLTGPEIAVFDAPHDTGDYALRTAYDGFSAPWAPRGGSIPERFAATATVDPAMPWPTSGVRRLTFRTSACRPARVIPPFDSPPPTPVVTRSEWEPSMRRSRQGKSQPSRRPA